MLTVQRKSGLPVLGKYGHLSTICAQVSARPPAQWNIFRWKCVRLWNSHSARLRRVNTQKNVREKKSQDVLVVGCGFRCTQVKQIRKDDLMVCFWQSDLEPWQCCKCAHFVKMCLKAQTLNNARGEWVSVYTPHSKNSKNKSYSHWLASQRQVAWARFLQQVLYSSGRVQRGQMK